MPHYTLFVLRRRSDSGGWWAGVTTWTRANTSVTLVMVNLVAYRRHLSICLRAPQRVGGFVVLPDRRGAAPSTPRRPPAGGPRRLKAEHPTLLWHTCSIRCIWEPFWNSVIVWYQFNIQACVQCLVLQVGEVLSLGTSSAYPIKNI